MFGVFAQDPQFVVALASLSRTPDVPETIRQRAETLFRYYPEAADMASVYNNCGHWSEPLE